MRISNYDIPNIIHSVLIKLAKFFLHFFMTFLAPEDDNQFLYQMQIF